MDITKVGALTATRFAETIPTNPLTLISRQKDGNRMIFMLQPGHDRICFFVRRVKSAPLIKLLDVRDYNITYGVIGVIPVDKRQIIIIYTKSKFVGDFLQLGYDLAHVVLRHPSRRTAGGRPVRSPPAVSATVQIAHNSCDVAYFASTPLIT